MKCKLKKKSKSLELEKDDKKQTTHKNVIKQVLAALIKKRLEYLKAQELNNLEKGIDPHFSQMKSILENYTKIKNLFEFQ